MNNRHGSKISCPFYTYVKAIQYETISGGWHRKDKNDAVCDATEAEAIGESRLPKKYTYSIAMFATKPTTI